MSVDPAVGLYVHLPFCRRKCHYCDFACFAGQERHLEAYLAALEAEISRYPRLRVRTLYLGGGTPSLLSADQLARLTGALEAHFEVAPDAERTMEINPATGDRDLWRATRATGFHRLSLGAQSFDDELLRRLGRDHTADDTRRTFAALREAGCTDLSLDLMYALPGQTMESWQATLEHALALGPEHFSVYGLILEERTAFGAWQRQGRLALPPEELELAMGDHLERRLAAAGYLRYEISSWAQPGHEAVHNRLYWRNEPYIGLGTGAHSYWNERRYANPRTLRDYLADPTPTWPQSDPLPLAHQHEETAFLALRMLREGLVKQRFAERFGLHPTERFGAALSQLVADGLLEDLGDRYVLTSRGVWLSNTVFAEFLSA